MGSITIEEDVYEALLRSAEAISILLRGASNAGARASASPSSADLPEQDRRLLAFVGSADFRHHRDVKGRYLAIISYLARYDPKGFGEVLQHSFGHRTYFARSKEDIKNSSRSVTSPRLIPETKLWALTNTSTHQKKLTLKRVLEILDYKPTTVAEVAARLGD